MLPSISVPTLVLHRAEEQFIEFLTGMRQAPRQERVLATVMFADIVGSTRTAVELGDLRWRQVLGSIEQSVRREVSHHRGRAVKTLGDGFLATFDGPARGIRCATAIRESIRSQFGLEVRSGLHTGEIELIGSDVGGIGVHIGARVGSNAAPGEVLVSGSRARRRSPASTRRGAGAGSIAGPSLP